MFAAKSRRAIRKAFSFCGVSITIRFGATGRYSESTRTNGVSDFFVKESAIAAFTSFGSKSPTTAISAVAVWKTLS